MCYIYIYISTSQGCGCWGTSSLGTSNLALMHNIILQDRDDKIKVENFSSTKFNQIFMTGPIPPNTPVTALEATQAFFNLEIAIDDCLDLINENDGFDVVLWYSRGEINDVSMTGVNVETEDSQVDSGKMCYHSYATLGKSSIKVLGHKSSKQAGAELWQAQICLVGYETRFKQI